MSIPVIDLSPFAAADAAGQARVARQVDAALCEIGFFAISGHGVPPETNPDTLTRLVELVHSIAPGQEI